MKKYNLLKVVLLTILVVAVCTWIFPVMQFDGYGELVDSGKNQLGIYDLFAYSVVALRNFPYVIVMALSIGAFYGVAYRIPAYRELLDSLVEKAKGKENILLIAIMTIIAALVSVTGVSFAILFVYPFIIALVLLMGYNKLVAASVTVGSTIVGIMGTTLGTNINYYINTVLNVNKTSEMMTKVVILVLGLALLIFNVIRYATKTKNNTDEVVECVPNKEKEVKVEVEKVISTEVKETKKSDKKVSKKKAPSKKGGKTKANDASTNSVKVVKNGKKTIKWPLILVFDLVLIILAVATFDWQNVANSSWAVDALDAVRKFTIDGFPIFDKLLGGVVNAFGQWNLMYEMPITILFAAGFLAFIYGLSFNKFIEGIVDGASKAMKPAIYMLLPYIVFIIAANAPFELFITKALLGLTKGLNVITMTVAAMLSSLLNIEPLYIAQNTLPYVANVINDVKLNPAIAIIFQSVYGLVTLVAPTSIILLGTLSYLDIPYTRWIKHIWKLFIELLLVLIVIFLVLVLV